MLSYVNEWLCFHIINDFVYFIFLPTNWGFYSKANPTLWDIETRLYLEKIKTSFDVEISFSHCNNYFAEGRFLQLLDLVMEKDAMSHW